MSKQVVIVCLYFTLLNIKTHLNRIYTVLAAEGLKLNNHSNKKYRDFAD